MTTAERFAALHARNPTAADDVAWYRHAAADCRARARVHGMPARRYAAVVAAMSPTLPWRTKHGCMVNLDAADCVVAGVGRGLPTSLSMALRILDGGRPLDILGQKTRAFYLNLTGRDAVTIDRWMMRAAGMPTDNPTPKQYAELSAAVRDVAAQFGIEPHELQASIWTQVKRESEES